MNWNMYKQRVIDRYNNRQLIIIPVKLVQYYQISKAKHIITKKCSRIFYDNVTICISISLPTYIMGFMDIFCNICHFLINI